MNRNRFNEVMKAFESRSVLVVGDILWDENVMCEPVRLSDEAAVPILKQQRIISNPGGAANVAMMCAKLGADVSLFGRVPCGVLRSPALLITTLNEAGVDTDGLLIDKTLDTVPTKRRIWAGHGVQWQQVVRVDEETVSPATFKHQELQHALSRCRNYGKWDVVLISDYNKGFCTLDVGLALPKQNRIALHPNRRFVDPPNRPDGFEHYCNPVWDTPTIVTNRKKAGERPAHGMAATRPHLLVVVTEGSEGCSMAYYGNETSRVIPTNPLVPIDPTGCGDQFLAVFGMASGLVTNGSAAKLANAAAGAQTQHLGCVPLTASQISDYMRFDGAED